MTISRFAFFTAAFCAAVSSSSAADVSSGGRLLVCNKGDHTLGVIDTARGRQIAVIQEDGVTGHEVIASPDGSRAFVPIYGNSGVGSPGTDGQLIQVIDLASFRIAATIDLGKGLRPHCAQIGPKNGHLYVTTEIGNCITEIDPATLKVVGSIPTGEPESHMLVISGNGRRGYTANVASGTVSVLDMKARKLVTIIPVAPKIQRIGISTDDKWVFTSDQTKPEIAIIDTKKNAVASSIPLPAKAYGSIPTPDGQWLLCVLPSNTSSPSLISKRKPSPKPSSFLLRRRKPWSVPTEPKPMSRAMLRTKSRSSTPRRGSSPSSLTPVFCGRACVGQVRNPWNSGGDDSVFGRAGHRGRIATSFLFEAALDFQSGRCEEFSNLLDQFLS